jgi:hypothetical protein
MEFLNKDEVTNLLVEYNVSKEGIESYESKSES